MAEQPMMEAIAKAESSRMGLALDEVLLALLAPAPRIDLSQDSRTPPTLDAELRTGLRRSIDQARRERVAREDAESAAFRQSIIDGDCVVSPSDAYTLATAPPRTRSQLVASRRLKERRTPKGGGRISPADAMVSQPLAS